MKILITGGTGMIGLKLSRLLRNKGHQVYHLSRSKREDDEFPAFIWDLNNGYLEEGALDGMEAIVHLAGANVGEGRWTASRKKAIMDSRTLSGELLLTHIAKQNKKPKLFISASAVGYYGAYTGDTLLSESSPAGSDFLANVCEQWESKTAPIENMGIRPVTLRIGVVLSREGGALPKILEPPVAAPIGSGEQYMSTIHIDDLVNIFLFAIENESLSGTYNAVGPEPISNRNFTQLAAKAADKVYIPIAVPGFLLKIALGEMSQIVLGGNKVSCDKLLEAGFQFEFPSVKESLSDLFRTK